MAVRTVPFTLPIDALLDSIVQAPRNVVIEAAPGAGKTTRVPPALLHRGNGGIVVLEPRRIAARMAARRVAQEMGVRIGAEVGYQVRFEEAAGPNTRIRFVTEGVLTRRLLTDPVLQGVSTVILDEFHERHLDSDLALALLRRLQSSTRPDLRLIVMSATLDASPVAAFLGEDTRRVVSEGRLYPIAIEYTPASSQPMETQVATAFERLLPLDDDVLAFLPGAAEIRRALTACEPLARKHGVTIFPLYGDLSPEEQDAAVQPLPHGRRKLILATNIAESSITIDGVSAVIDSGLARVASDSPWTGLPTLRVTRISRASATQRAGRAGRTRAGRVIRLYTQEDFARRPEFDTPEIQRRELSQMLLDLRAMDIHDLAWLTAPPAEAWQAAATLLDRLSATGEIARRMSRLPLHPRLSRLVVEAEKRGCGGQGCEVAAALSAGERRLLLHRRDWQPNTVRTYEQLVRSIRQRGRDDDEALGLALLAAFPDRVAKRQRDREITLSGGGGSAVLAEDFHGKFLLAVDIEDRKEKGAPIVRIAHRIEPEWLIELFPDRIEERDAVEWNRSAERVETVSALVYDGLTIEETRGGDPPDPRAAAAMLAAKAMESDIGRFVDREELEQYLARARFAFERGKLFQTIDMAHVQNVLADLCYGKRSLKELAASAGVIPALDRSITPVRLDEVAPTRLTLPSGRKAKVEYAAGQAPWVSSRLQDFFGLKETPRIAGVPLVAHLLAPNQRPVQVTSDLAGFWERHYPGIRKELMRRYPRHSWPERPA
jgi:ATP-dependent helicase HrpB